MRTNEVKHKLVIPVDDAHRILQIDNKLYPQWKGLIFWNYYKFRDICQDFEYIEEDEFYSKKEREKCIRDMKKEFEEYDYDRIERGGWR